MHFLRTSPLALALAALLSSGAAHAVSTHKASAEITQLKIELIDLRPDDGIAPSVTFATTQFHSTSNYATPDHAGDEFKETFSPGSTAIARTYGGTAAWSTPTTLGANAQVWTAGDYGDFSLGSYSQKDLYYHSLSAYTLLRVSGTVVLDVKKSGNETTHAWASWSGLTDLGYPVTPLNRAEGALELTQGALTQDFSFDLYGDYRNYGDLYFATGAFSSTSPVPEPATCGMLLAGLAVVGLRRRRKRQG